MGEGERISFRRVAFKEVFRGVGRGGERVGERRVKFDFRMRRREVIICDERRGFGVIA